MGNIEYRIGTLAELATVVSFKIRMFQEVGADALLADDASSTIGQEYERLFQKGDLQHFLAVEGEETVACAVGLIKRDTPFCFFRTPFSRICRGCVYGSRKQKARSRQTVDP